MPTAEGRDHDRAVQDHTPHVEAMVCPVVRVTSDKPHAMDRLRDDLNKVTRLFGRCLAFFNTALYQVSAPPCPMRSC